MASPILRIFLSLFDLAVVEKLRNIYSAVQYYNRVIL